ncbi:hypothetical protein K2Y11_12755 [bacterium]|nr:hypothetical protein [bacterium]
MGSTTKTETKQTNDPWAPAQPYILQGLGEAQSVYEQQKAANTPGYQGDFIAQPTAQQTAGANSLMSFAGGSGAASANAALNSGTALTGLGGAATSSAISGLNAFANRDATGQNIAAASQYANNPYMDSMVGAATRDATRNFNEVITPGINANAAATGNLNSTRTGVAAGIAQRGLQDTIADTSAQLRGQAYQQGISQASTDAQAQAQAYANAGQLGSAMTNSGIGATNAGSNSAMNNASIFNIGNALAGANNQAPLDNALAKQDYANTQPWTNLNNYFAVSSGGGSLGGTSTGTSTQKTNPGALGILGGGLGILGSFMKCDVRTKNIGAKVGVLTTGEPIYVFTYKDDTAGTIHMGPMAQDIEITKPDAIVEIDGIKHIHIPTLVSAIEGGRV